ncbi:MAG: PDZ domain-containing protein [Oscillospiraceae bacterium]|nr:PDZ domain-containing protein [Oscillospiraceae bacterium]
MGRSIRAGAAALWICLLLATPALGAEPTELVPVGRTVGLELETDGVYVAAFDEEGDSPAEAAGLLVGDRILAVNGEPLDRAEALRQRVAAAGGGAVELELERDGRILRRRVRPAARDGQLRLGLRVRDRISGLGTVTFYDPDTGLFGALGHGVSADGDSPLLIRGGEAAETAVTEVRKGEKGSPGSLLGPSSGGAPLGRIALNTDRGLFGYAEGPASEEPALPLAEGQEVRGGPAEIICCVEGSEPLRYAVEIEAVRLDPERCRDLRIRVTDPRLLERTGGIVRGMSGSPILQNGKLVGAVTHVLVRDPTRGYGILIGHMLEAVRETDRAA